MGSFTNYVDKILVFFNHLPPVLTFSMVYTLTKSGHVWTTHLPRHVNVVCERPLLLLLVRKLKILCKGCEILPRSTYLSIYFKLALMYKRSFLTKRLLAYIFYFIFFYYDSDQEIGLKIAKSTFFE